MRSRLLLRAGVAPCAIAVALALAAGAHAADRNEAPDTPAFEAFRERVEAYAALHRDVAGEVGPLRETDTPAQIQAREERLAAAIRARRASARPGDLFGDASGAITAIVRADWSARAPADRRALLAEVPASEPPAVNSTYPPSQPLATFPPKLLLQLPELPEELEYRFQGRDLILRDSKANLVADVLPGALEETR